MSRSLPRQPSTARLAALLGVYAALLVVFLTVARPWYRSWNITEDERGMALPGDSMLTAAAVQETRAITIYSPIDRVWPWVAQIGQDRGGFYSFDLLENIVGSQMPTRDYLRPDKQDWQVGDRLWMHPPLGGRGVGSATLRSYVPGRALAFVTQNPGSPEALPESGSWTVAVQPIDEAATRLIVRGRAVEPPSTGWLTLNVLVFEPMHFVMERRMMLGIKELAERGVRTRTWNHIQVVIWTVAFGLLVAAVVMAMRCEEWERPMLGVFIAGVMFMVLTFVQPAIIVAVTGLLLVEMTLWGKPHIRLPRLARVNSFRPWAATSQR